MKDEVRIEILNALLSGEDRKVREILEKNIPAFLYKFRSGNQLDLAALENNTIWIGCATEMDDPYDANLILEKNFKEKAKTIIENVDKDKRKEYRNILEDCWFQKECFLCSFSEVYDNDDMWKMYADNNTGISIEYSASELYFNIGYLLLPVVYFERPVVDYDFCQSSKRVQIFNNFLLKKRYGENGEDWYSQREWRIIAFRKNLDITLSLEKGKCISVPKPTRIIFASNIKKQVEEQILEWSKKEENKNVEIVRFQKGDLIPILL